MKKDLNGRARIIVVIHNNEYRFEFGFNKVSLNNKIKDKIVTTVLTKMNIIVDEVTLNSLGVKNEKRLVPMLNTANMSQ
jgi:hypothetical protein